MLSLISALVASAELPGPRSAAQVPIETGTQLPVARLSSRADDGFSLAVGTKAAADVGALTGAGRNAEEGASLLRAAATGLDEIADVLVRMKELATLPSTTSFSRRELAIMNAEFERLRTEIDNIADRTRFNDIKVLEGVSLVFKVGTGNASQDSVTVSLSAATVAGLDADLASDTIADTTSASLALTDVTGAIDALKGIQASVDGAAVRFQGVQRSLTSYKNILTALRTDLLERPVTIGTADNLANLVSQEFLSRAAPAVAAQLSSAERVLLSTSQLQPIEPSQAGDQTQSQEQPQTKAVKRPSAYETGQNTKSSSRSETAHSVDIKA
ncbi:MAG: flagellin N-terminal helical domain-containing protein [Alphaproteobacteria bacterium]